MNPVTDPPRPRPRGTRGPSSLRRFVDAALDQQGQRLDDLMAGWLTAQVEWPDVLNRLEALTGQRLTKNTLKNWFPDYRLPRPGRDSQP